MEIRELLEQARANELTAIEKKVAAGSVLSARELAILEAAADPPLPSPDFALEADQSPGPLAGLTQAQLASRYGYSQRAVKKWIHDGREKSIPAPLDRPEEMIGWFGQVYDPRQAPQKLRLAVQSILAEIATPANAPEAPPPRPRVEVAEAEQGFEAMLRRLRNSEATKFREYEQAVEDQDVSRAGFLFSEWTKIVEKLRALEKTAGQTLETMGIFVRKEEVARELAQIHAAIPRSLKMALRRLRRKASEAAADPAAWNLFVEEYVDRCCNQLVDTGFVEPLELDVA